MQTKMLIGNMSAVQEGRPVLNDHVYVVIPALNEVQSIASVVGRLQALGLRQIRVVDNGSTDGTPASALAAGADVVGEPVRGYGMACWRGIQNLPGETHWILFCDADGCDDLEAWPRMTDAANSGADFVIANRLASPQSQLNLTLPQRFGNRLATTLIARIWGAKFSDLGPMRLIRRDLLDQIGMQDRGFGWTVEMQIRVAQLGAPYAEVPVGYHARRYGRSKISGTVRGVVMAGSVILSTIARHALRGRTFRPAFAGIKKPGRRLSAARVAVP